MWVVDKCFLVLDSIPGDEVPFILLTGPTAPASILRVIFRETETGDIKSSDFINVPDLDTYFCDRVPYGCERNGLVGNDGVVFIPISDLSLKFLKCVSKVEQVSLAKDNPVRCAVFGDVYSNDTMERFAAVDRLNTLFCCTVPRKLSRGYGTLLHAVGCRGLDCFYGDSAYLFRQYQHGIRELTSIVVAYKVSFDDVGVAKSIIGKLLFFEKVVFKQYSKMLYGGMDTCL